MESKGEVAMRRTFIVFGLMIFLFLVFDLALTSVVVGDTLVQAINLIPLI